MQDTRILTYEERMTLIIALEMAQAFMKRTTVAEFVMDAPDRYLNDLEDTIGLHNRFTNLIEELDPDKK